MNELLSAHLNSVIIGGKLETSWSGLPRKSVADRALPGPLSGLLSTRTRALPRAVIRPSTYGVMGQPPTERLGVREAILTWTTIEGPKSNSSSHFNDVGIDADQRIVDI